MQTGSQYNEKELLYLLKQNSEPAFEKIYQLYSARLFGNLIKLVKSESTAQEILQNVFLKIWEARQSIDPEKSFRSFLFKIAENKVYDYYRKAARNKKLYARLMAVATEHYEHVEDLLFKKENTAILEKAINRLSPQRQQVFRLCKLDGKSYGEIGRLLGISTSTISDHIVKANKAVREYLFQNLDMAIFIAGLSLL